MTTVPRFPTLLVLWDIWSTALTPDYLNIWRPLLHYVVGRNMCGKGWLEELGKSDAPKRSLG
jgi:hypothetical protein